MLKLCERCKSNSAIKEKRYCSKCQPFIIKELENAGYLDKHPPWLATTRKKHQMEDTYETKYGPRD